MRNLVQKLGLTGILLSSHFGFSQVKYWASPNISAPGATPPPASIQPLPSEPCARPAELFDIDDYDGPLNKLVAGFSQKLEIKTVSSSHPHRHLPPCSLTAGEKFHLFVENSFEPVNFLGAAWDAGWAQRDKDDPAFGQGAAGYSKRYAAEVADNIQGDLFNTFVYPAVFRQDPRYYRLGHGSAQQRIFHAVRHVFVAHSDSGHLMFNFSEWLGTASSKAVSNLYHPGNQRGIGATAQRAGLSITADMGFDVLREFYPQLAHRFHLPFKAAATAY